MPQISLPKLQIGDVVEGVPVAVFLDLDAVFIAGGGTTKCEESKGKESEQQEAFGFIFH